LAVVVVTGRAHERAQWLHLVSAFAYQARHLLVIDHQALAAELMTDAPIAKARKLSAQYRNPVADDLFLRRAAAAAAVVSRIAPPS
jgi:hypothetical protein